MPHNITWIVLSLIAPLFWGTSNVVDQFLVRGEFEGRPWLYAFVQSMFYLPLLIAFPFFFPVVLETSFHDAVFMMLVGTTWVPFVGLYLTALKGDDASVAIPIFNVIPFFVLIGGWLFLNETISMRQIASGSVLVLCAAAVTWDFHAGKLRLKTLSLMLAACGLYAFYLLIARDRLATLHWSQVYFWYCMGSFLTCLTAVSLFAPSRTRLVSFFRHGSKTALFLSFIQSWLDVAGFSCMTAAVAAAPAAALASFVSSVQPLYVLAAGGVMACFHPQTFDAVRADRKTLWKISCIVVMLAALYSLLEIS